MATQALEEPVGLAPLVRRVAVVVLGLWALSGDDVPANRVADNIDAHPIEDVEA